MCGIVAALAKYEKGFVKDEVNFFKQMLQVDAIRGPDATGVWGTFPSGNVVWTKIGENPYALFQTKEWDQWEDRMQKSLVTAVGHNRWATSGGVDSEHAHPFVKDHIIMVHNGGIWNHAKIRPDAPKGSVDSECIAHLLAREDDHVKAIEQLEGAYAIIWYNAKQKRTYFCHNEERPLHYLETDGVIFLMSEDTALNFLKARNGVKEEFKVMPVPTNRIFCWDHDTLQMSSVEYKPYVAPAVATHGGPFHGHLWESYYDDSTVLAPDLAQARREWEDDRAAARIAPATVLPEERQSYDAAQKIIEFKPAGNVRENITVFQKLVRSVPIGSSVTIAPSRCLPWDIPQVDGRRLECDAEFDGLNVVYKYSGEDIAMMEGLGKAKMITGKVVSHLIASDHAAIWLKEVHAVVAAQTFKTFNGFEMTFKEWQQVYRNCECRTCKGKLLAPGMKLTSVQFKKGKQEYSVVCPKCTVKAFKAVDDATKTLMEAKAGFNVQEKATALGVWS